VFAHSALSCVRFVCQLCRTQPTMEEPKSSTRSGKSLFYSSREYVRVTQLIPAEDLGE
jgi:hypothetical protein